MANQRSSLSDFLEVVAEGGFALWHRLAQEVTEAIKEEGYRARPMTMEIRFRDLETTKGAGRAAASTSPSHVSFSSTMIISPNRCKISHRIARVE
jgi:hypothetical protein